MDKYTNVSNNTRCRLTEGIKKEQPVVIARFENGNLKSSRKSKLKFTSYKSDKKISKRILVAKSSKLCYIGSNFESSLSKITSSVLKICVLNKENKTLKFLDADFFQLKPQLKCMEIKDMKSEKSYTEKSSDLTLAFGSKIQMKKINSRIKYGSSEANSFNVNLKSISDAAVGQINMDMPNEDSTPSIIPPQNNSAMNVDEVYNIYDIISKEEFYLLESEAQIFLTANQDNIQLWKKENKYSDFILQFMENNVLYMDVNKAKLLCYIHYMFCFLRTGYRDWKKKDPVPGVPDPFKQKLMDCFTVNKSMPMRLKDKLLAYSMVLGLKLNNYNINCNVLASSAKMAVKRITSVAYALGCHVSGNKTSNIKTIVLKLPLYKLETKKKFK